MKLVEIKALCDDLVTVRKIASDSGFQLFGIDDQEDTYFRVNSGILKIRDGKIEKTMIYYDREKTAAPSVSEFSTYNSSDQEGLKRILSSALGIIGVVRKTREIYIRGCTVLHLDELEDGRRFLEIEVLGEGSEEDSQTCERFMELFGIQQEMLTRKSYFELVMGYEIEKQ